MSNADASIVESKIYLVRRLKVMLDSDLAELYGVETRVLNQAVRRNSGRFPIDFMFQLTDIEWKSLKSQFVTSKTSRGGKQKLPLVFTEFGVAMLSSVISSEQAIQTNIAIMRAFGRLRRVLETNQDLAIKLAQLEARYDGQFKAVFAALRELMSNHVVPRKRVVGLDKP